MSELEDKLQALVTLPNHAIELGLERINRLLAVLGNPHLQLPPIIHVAGTNGKGSTIAFMRAMLEAAGQRVHVFTSPHLLRFNERIRIAGELATDEQLLSVFEEIAAANQGEAITYFEMTTVAAFMLFARTPADVVLLEVGLGGRLDATNVITPAVSVITRISMDHTQHLGDTLEKIAAEKAGIMKPGVPCVIGYQADEGVKQVFRNRATELNCPLYEYSRDFVTEELIDGFKYFDHLSFSLEGEGGTKCRMRGVAATAQSEFQDISQPLPPSSVAPLARHLLPQGRRVNDLYPFPALLGAHQILNAANAITALKLFMPEISEAAITQGLHTVHWPGRLQRITTGPLAAMLPPNAELWYDGAHNDSGAEALAEQCRRWREEGIEIHLITGMLKTKDPLALILPIRPHICSIHTMTVDTEQSSYSAHKLVNIISNVAPHVPVTACETLEAAITNSMRSPNIKTIWLIAGSLYIFSHLNRDSNILA